MKMSLHDDAREELVQSMGISHEEANRMINRNTPEAQSAFERVYDQKQHSIQNKPMIRQSDWSIKSSSSDLRKQYASSEKAMNENMAESQSNMKFANKNDELNKNINAGRQKINVEKGEIVQKVNERAKDGTVVRAGKQFWNNATKLNPWSDEKE